MANYTPDMQKPSIWRRKRGSNLFYKIRRESFIHGWKTPKRQVKTSCFYEEYILTSLNSAIQTQVAEDAAFYPSMCAQGRSWHFTPLVVPGNSKWSKSFVRELGDFKHYVYSSLNLVGNFRDYVRNLRRFLKVKSIHWHPTQPGDVPLHLIL